ncbi:Ig-like domain-containing protein [Mycobacterium sp. PSTR-4-N]|uniref:Ig-like domain-containing protein n=1 Tax=Mycobacterium sp. PSTR-4-N TaxID=2917745 RepID=UPI001F14B445|nr:Ig-like domain-containing protein [Mycobacterium sp. PSTR-4-N]MCG7595837.1 Ig-like domain-containing protein [Mycobacterium sp. PSTR-4-N]
MGSSKHIGRIGALAFALGVGIGIGATPGVAWADDSSDSTPSVSSNADTTTASDTGGRTPDKPTRNNRKAQRAVRTDADASTDDAKPSRKRKQRAIRDDAGAETSTVQRTRVRTPEPDDDSPSGATTVAPAPQKLVASVAEVPMVTADVVAPTQQPDTEERASATTRVRLVELLTSGLTPKDAPVAPVASPAMWVLAAAARRQLGQADAPVVNPPDETGVVTGEVVVADADSAVASGPGKGTVVVSVDGDTVSFEYTPTKAARHAAAAVGADPALQTDSFVLTVVDGAGDITTVPITVAVAPANAAPVVRVSRPRMSPFGDGEVRVSVRVRDFDGDAYTYSLSPTAKGGTVTIDEVGHISYMPTAAARHAAAAADATEADKTDTFDVTVTDGYGGVTTVSLTVPIRPDNIDPDVTVRTRTSPFSSTVTGVVIVRDPNGDPVTYEVGDTNKGGTVVIDERGRFTYTPTAQARHAASADNASQLDKQDSFVITVTDDHGGITRTLVTVAVKPANVAPTSASVENVFTNPNTGVVTGAITAVDADGDSFTYRSASTTRKGTVTLAEDGTFVYTPSDAARARASRPFAPRGAKNDSFRVIIDDGHGGTTALTVRVGIAPLGGENHAPVDGSFTAGTPNVFTGKVTGSVTATDPDQDPLSYSGTELTPKGSVVVNADGTFTYTPSAAARHQAGADDATEQDKVDTFVVTAADGFGGTLAVPVMVSIKPSANRAPSQLSYTATTDEATGLVSGQVTAKDADGDLLIYRGTTVTEKGSVVVTAAGGFTYVPTDAARAAAGAPKAPLSDKRDAFVVTVDDGHGGTSDITVRVTIVPTTVTSVL